MKDGTIVADEQAIANAHTRGATPWTRADYVGKFGTLTAGILDPAEAERFLDAAQSLAELRPEQMSALSISIPEQQLSVGRPGLF